MNLKERIEDLKLIAKTDRRVWAGAGFLFLAFILFLGTNSGPQRAKKFVPQTQQQAGRPGTGPTEAYNDLIQVFRNDIDVLDRRSSEQDQRMRRVEQNLEKFQERTAGVLDSMLDKIDAVVRNVEQIEQGGVRVVGGADGVQGELAAVGTPTDPQGQVQVQEVVPELEKWGMEEATVEPPPAAPPQPRKVTVISPGDAVKLRLLTGVAAPVDGTPYPVMFKLASDISGPDGSILNLGEARLIAAAQGSEVDSRVLFRLTDLSIRHNDGRRSVVKVDGWVVGEDGVRGMRGKLIDKLGQLIAATAGTSALAALAERIDERNQAVSIGDVEGGVTVSADDLNVATASAVTDASNRIGSVLLDRYEKQVPVVEVLSGRDAVAIFSKPVEIELCEEDCDDEDPYYLSSLD